MLYFWMATTQKPETLLDYEQTRAILDQTMGYKRVFDGFMDEYRKAIRLTLEEAGSIELVEEDKDILKMWVGDTPSYEELESLNEDAAKVSHYLSMRMSQLECSVPVAESERENSHKHTSAGHRYGEIESSATKRYRTLKDAKEQLDEVIELAESYAPVPTPHVESIEAEVDDLTKSLEDVSLPEEYWPLTEPETF